jgi:hypothetical protein
MLRQMLSSVAANVSPSRNTPSSSRNSCANIKSTPQHAASDVANLFAELAIDSQVDLPAAHTWWPPSQPPFHINQLADVEPQSLVHQQGEVLAPAKASVQANQQARVATRTCSRCSHTSPACGFSKAQLGKHRLRKCRNCVTKVVASTEAAAQAIKATKGHSAATASRAAMQLHSPNATVRGVFEHCAAPLREYAQHSGPGGAAGLSEAQVAHQPRVGGRIARARARANTNAHTTIKQAPPHAGK